MRRIRYLKPATSFRSAYAYDNILYMAAGPADRGSQRPDLGAVHPATTSSAARDDQLDRHRRRVPGESRTARGRTAAPAGRSVGLGTQTPLDENATIAPERRTRGRPGDQRQRHDPLAADAARTRQDPGQRQAPVLRRTVRGDVDRRGDPRRSASFRRSSRSPSRTSTSMRWAGTLQDYRGAKLIWHGGAVFGSLADGRAAAGQECRHFHRRQQRGRRDRPRPALRAARPLSRLPASRMAGEVPRLQDRHGSTRPRKQVRPRRPQAGEGRPVASARSLRRRLCRPWYGDDQGPPVRQGPRPSTSRIRRAWTGR